MSTTTPVDKTLGESPARPWAQVTTALETPLVYAGILLYIWRWQYIHPRAWMALVAFVVLSHLAHGDRLRDLGVTISGLRANATVVLPVMLAMYTPMLVYGFARHVLVPIPPGKQALIWFANYGLWCIIQQYLAQSYFNNRLMSVVRNRHLSSLLVGLMFGAAHLPNPILTVATTIAGFIFAEAFARHRNIWPLALAQTVGGFLIAAISPSDFIHNMRVGPGYFFFHAR